MDSMKHIRIFDTTLRDGEQAPGNAMDADKKIEMFSKLDDLGVHTVETGFPSATDYDFYAAREIALMPRKSKICTFARANEDDLETCMKALNGASNFQVQILLVGSEIHLEHKRKITEEMAIKEAVTSIDYLSSRGVQDISVIIEDSTRGSYEYLQRLIDHSVEAGATTIALADTVGCSSPFEFGELVKTARSWIGENINLSVHCHDDLGLALANSLAAITNGADEIQTTLCGIGERAGNTALEELVAVLLYKQKQLNAYTSVDSMKLFDACQCLINQLKIPIARHKAIIGDYVFSTEAGIHQQGFAKNPVTYQFVEPQKFGRTSRMIIGPHSGRSILKHKLESNHIHVEPAIIDELYKVIMDSDDIYQFNNPEILVSKYYQIKSNAHSSILIS